MNDQEKKKTAAISYQDKMKAKVITAQSNVVKVLLSEQKKKKN